MGEGIGRTISRKTWPTMFPGGLGRMVGGCGRKCFGKLEWSKHGKDFGQWETIFAGLDFPFLSSPSGHHTSICTIIWPIPFGSITF